MVMTLVASLGSWLSGKLLGKLGGRITQKWADMLSVWAMALVGALVAAGVVYFAYSWAWDRGRDHERARWEAASAKVEAADVKADAKGLATAAEEKETIDAQVERAREDAHGSDDPIGAIADSLRSKDRSRRDAPAP